MAGNSLFWLQSVASVLSFTPPGLLLIATHLRLQQIPVVRTSGLLNLHRLRISRATGSTGVVVEDPAGNASHSKFLRRLNEAIERSCRRGENPLPSIVVLEQLTRSTGEPLARIQQVLSGLLARTAMAVVFAEILCGVLRWLQAEPQLAQHGHQDPRTVWLAAAAAGCITTCGCLWPLAQIRRAADLLNFSEGKTAEHWIDSMRTMITGRAMQRHGIAFDDEVERSLRDEFQDRMNPVLILVMKAERWTVVYEMVALMPATALLTLGRIGL